jgi:hypothetical protein
MNEPESENEPSVLVLRELQRILGDDPPASKHFILLPLVNESDALAFLRTVPAGTSLEQLVPLASAYRAANPSVGPELDESDLDQAL